MLLLNMPTRCFVSIALPVYKALLAISSVSGALTALVAVSASTTSFSVISCSVIGSEDCGTLDLWLLGLRCLGRLGC